MTVTARTLVPVKTAETTLTTQYTAINVTSIIDKFTATNYTANDATLTVYLTNPAESPATASMIVKEQIIGGGETYTFPELSGHVLEPGGRIATLANTALALNIRASGREIS